MVTKQSEGFALLAKVLEKNGGTARYDADRSIPFMCDMLTCSSQTLERYAACRGAVAMQRRISASTRWEMRDFIGDAMPYDGIGWCWSDDADQYTPRILAAVWLGELAKETGD